MTEHQIISWIEPLRKSSSRVLVSDYSYNCLFTGCPKTKTLIVFPDEIESRGIMSIDKPMQEVGILDLFKLFDKIK